MLSQNENNENKLNELFNAVAHWRAKEFVGILEEYDPNIKHNGIPLLHFIIRNAGPAHLKALIEFGADVNLLTDPDAHYEENLHYAPASALQWITGMMLPENHHLGWPQNYTNNRGSSLVIIDGRMQETGFEGSANEIMFQISNYLLFKGAKLDFYSACALGYISEVKKYLNNPEWLNAPGPDGGSALAWAARRGQNEIVSLLLSHGVDVNQFNTVSSLTPLEEAVLYHGTKATVELLVRAGAVIRKGIIGVCCKSRIDMLEALLSHVDNPSQLITVDDLRGISTKVYYKEYLEVFAKSHISLSEIDKEMESLGFPLIFCGCSFGREAIPILRLVIALGCNLNAIALRNRDFKNKENVSPLAFLSRRLPGSDSEDKLEVLQKMAIVFFHGSSIVPPDGKQSHSLQDLHGIDLISFLLFLYEEVKLSNEPYALFKINSDSRNILKEKINEAFSSTQELENSEMLVFILKKLLDCCDPSLSAVNTMVKHGVFKAQDKINTHESPLEKIKKYYRSSNKERESTSPSLNTESSLITLNYPNSSKYVDAIMEQEKIYKRLIDQNINLKIINDLGSQNLSTEEFEAKISLFLSSLPPEQRQDVLDSLRSDEDEDFVNQAEGSISNSFGK